MLRALEKDMGAFGADLWSGGAVREVKVALDGRIEEAIKRFVERVEEEGKAFNGHAEGAEEDERDGEKDEHLEKEKLTQMLFDTLCLQRAISAEKNSGGEDRLAGAADELVKAAGIEDAELNRLRKSATEYWKKSYLLFALLAG
jgi:hypothetical protein